MCVYWEIQKFNILEDITNIVEIFHVSNKLIMPDILFNVLIGTATHAYMGFPINFNFNYLEHNVYYYLEN